MLAQTAQLQALLDADDRSASNRTELQTPSDHGLERDCASANPSLENRPPASCALDIVATENPRHLCVKKGPESWASVGEPWR